MRARLPPQLHGNTFFHHNIRLIALDPQHTAVVACHRHVHHFIYGRIETSVCSPENFCALGTDLVIRSPPFQTIPDELSRYDDGQHLRRHSRG